MARGRPSIRSSWAVGLVAAALAASTLAVADDAAADPIDDQRARVSELTDELERLEETSDILAEDYVTAIDEQRRLDGEVAAAVASVAEREAQVAALRSQLVEVAVRAFMGAGTDGLAPMLNASADYTEDLQREQLSRVAMSTGDATTDELDQAVADLQQQQSDLEDKQTAAAAAAEVVDAAQAATEERKAEYEQARADAEAELGRLIQEEEERRARESYEAMQRAAEEAAAAAAAAEEQARAVAQQQADAAAAEAAAAEEATSSAEVAAAPPIDDGDGGGRGGGEAAAAAAAPAAEPAPEPEPVSIPPASSRAQTAVNAALSQLGVPYQYAQSSPGVAFDCSGLTKWAWGQAGVSLPHQSRAQYAAVAHVPVEAAQPGDLIFYYSPISHVGIYLGDGQLVHAPNSGSVVNVATVNWSKVTGVGRPG